MLFPIEFLAFRIGIDARKDGAKPAKIGLVDILFIKGLCLSREMQVMAQENLMQVMAQENLYDNLNLSDKSKYKYTAEQKNSILKIRISWFKV